MSFIPAIIVDYTSKKPVSLPGILRSLFSLFCTAGEAAGIKRQQF